MIYAFGVKPVHPDFMRKVQYDLEVAKKKRECPPYLRNLLDLCLPVSRIKLRQECGLEVQCEHCD